MSMVTIISPVYLHYVVNIFVGFQFNPLIIVSGNYYELKVLFLAIPLKNYEVQRVISFVKNIPMVTIISFAHLQYVGNISAEFHFNPVIIARGADYTNSVPSIGTNTWTHTNTRRHRCRAI